MDPSWCPGCDKLILPKRYLVPVVAAAALTAPPAAVPAAANPPAPAEVPAPAPAPAPVPSPTPAHPPASPAPSSNQPPPPPAPTPVPSSPEVHKKPVRRPPHHVYAHGGGLVHGTGRVRPGGGIKPPPGLGRRQQQQNAPKPVLTPPRPAAHAQVVGNPTAHGAVAPTPTVAPALAPLPRKTRVVISQDPTPLYCSDECRARDLKNSFIESETLGFAGASAARERVAQLELVQQTVELTMRSRQASSASVSEHVRTEAATAVDLDPVVPPVPPNSLVNPPPPLFRTPSTESESAADDTMPASRSSTIRARSSRARPRLPRSVTTPAASMQSPQRPTLPRTPSLSACTAWGSPTKSTLAPPARSLFQAHAASALSCSLDSHSSASSAAVSTLFEDDVPPKKSASSVGVDTCGTTPSRRGSGSSASLGASVASSASGSATGCMRGAASGKKGKGKRVSFASDAKPAAAEIVPLAEKVGHQDVASDWRRPRRRNPLMDANPLGRDAVSVSPKDRINRTASLPDAVPDAPHPPAPANSRSTPSISPKVVDTPPPHARRPYSIAMWPEDAKRTTESARVHGELLRGYAKRFRPREGRSFVWGRLWEGSEVEDACRALPVDQCDALRFHEMQPDSKREYWRGWEEREAEARARRRAEELVAREVEERVICEMLGGAGMREEDQPQARRMKRMAYDGMPGPAEQRGLTYKFDRFLYPLMPPKPTIVEKTVRRFDEKSGQWVEEVHREEVFERKKLFNFEED